MSNPPTAEPIPQPSTLAAPSIAEPTLPPTPAPAPAPAPAATPASASAPGAVDPSVMADDTSMADAPEAASSPVPVPQAAASAPSPVPARTGTPSRNLNNGEAGSRAGSVHPDTNAVNLPTQATPHGDSARMYINSTVTAALLEGMKKIGRDQPPNPLKVLGEFLLQKSRERGEPESG